MQSESLLDLSDFYVNGIWKALVSLIYPIKYLSEPFLTYNSFLVNTTLLVSILSMLVALLFLLNAFLLIHLLTKNKTFLYSYTV